MKAYIRGKVLNQARTRYRHVYIGASPVWMPHCGFQMQGPTSRCLLCLSKDTYRQMMPLICLVYTDGCQMRYGNMSAASCTKAQRTNNLVQPMMRLSIAQWPFEPFERKGSACTSLSSHPPRRGNRLSQYVTSDRRLTSILLLRTAG